MIPRIALNNDTYNFTITKQIETGLLIYNTANNINVKPGFYFWDGNVWKPITGSTTSSTTGNAWNLTGNSNTDENSNYIGTSDWKNLILKVRNTEIAKFKTQGEINLGLESIAIGSSAVAVGYKATANANYSFAIGAEATTSSQYSYAIGNKASASQNDTYAIGSNANASEYQAIAIGKEAKASQNDTYAIGNKANASGYQSIAIGNDTKAKGGSSIAIGNKAETSQNNAIVIGENNTNTKIGMGTSTPDEKLHVVGSVKIVDGTQGSGKILVSDATGKASWQTPVKVYADLSIKNDITVTNTTATIPLTEMTTYSEVSNSDNGAKVSISGHYKVTCTVTVQDTSGNNSGNTIDVSFGQYGNTVGNYIIKANLSKDEIKTISLTRIINLSDIYNPYHLYVKTTSRINVLSQTTNLVLEKI